MGGATQSTFYKFQSLILASFFDELKTPGAFLTSFANWISGLHNVPSEITRALYSSDFQTA